MYGKMEADSSKKSLRDMGEWITFKYLLFKMFVQGTQTQYLL